MSESNQRRDNDYNYSSQDDPDDLDRENAQEDGRDNARNSADDMNRRGMMIDSDVRHQAGTDLHDGSEYDQQEGTRYEQRMGSGNDMQEGARSAGNRMEGSDFDREESSRYDANVNAGSEDDLNRRGAMMNADLNRQANAGPYVTSGYGEGSHHGRGTRMNADDMQGEDMQGDARMGDHDLPGQYESSTPGYGMVDEPARRGSGTGETDVRDIQESGNTGRVSHVGDDSFSDTVTPTSGKGRIRVDPEGNYSLADTEETQADHFQAERDAQGLDDADATTVQTQAEHFQEERNALNDDDTRSVAQSRAGAGRKSRKKVGGKTDMTNMSNTRTIAAIFRNWDDASRAVSMLQDAGFDDSQIGIARLDTEKGKVRSTSASGATKDDGERVAGGVATGAAVGGVAGLLAALASLVIPGVGPIVAGGVLATTFGSAAGAAITGAGVGAGIGAAAGGLIGALTSLGLSEEEARAYESGMRSGGTLVTVRADGREEEAARMLQQMGGETHGGYGRQSGSSSDPNWRFG